MSGMIDTWNRAAALWWEWTVTATWQGMVLLAAVVAVLALGRRIAPGVRYGLLLLVLLKLAVPPVVGITHSFSDLLTGAVTPAPAPATAPAPVTEPTAVTIQTGPATVREPLAKPIAPVSPRGISMSRDAWLLCIELAGALSLLLLIARQFRRNAALLGASSGADEDLAEQFRRMTAAVGLWRRPNLWISEEAGAPQSGGVLRPYILLPAWVKELPSEERDI